jgi:hypothetical protein
LTKKIDINKKIINKEIEKEKYIGEIIFDKNLLKIND